MTCVDVDVDVYRPKLSRLSTFINQIIVHVDCRYDPCKYAQGSGAGPEKSLQMVSFLQPPAKKKSAASGYDSRTPALALVSVAAGSTSHLPYQQLRQQILCQHQEVQSLNQGPPQ